MQIVLDNKDLNNIDSLIKDIPFQYAYPIFQYFRSKVEQEQAKAQSKPEELPEQTT